MRKTALAVVVLTLTLAACGRTATPAATGANSVNKLDAGVQALTPLNPVSVPQASGPVNETTGLWFVELLSPPAADGGNLANTQADKRAFRQAAKAAGIKYSERYAYDTLFNGLSVKADMAQAAAIQHLSGVKDVYPVARESMPPTEPGLSPELFTAIDMTGARIVQNELGYTGKGVKVAVMDTGIDYNHPAFAGGSGFGGSRVEYGTDLVGDAYNADETSSTYNPVPVPDNDPMDCAGHGTHVAGIIGAHGVVTGVAPDVTFGAYRVFGCEGSTTDDVMIAAMERVLADHMDVLNMSIGSSYGWPESPTAKASTRLVNMGVTVVASIGNSGANGLWAAGAPGVGDKVIGVASIDNTHVYLPAFTISPDGMAIGYTGATAAPVAPTTGTYPMARTGTQASTADGCTALASGSLAGKIALIRRGTCGFYNKALNAQNAGAAGVVLYNNQPGIVNPTVAGAVTITIPVVMITRADGNLIDTRLATGPVDLTWTDTHTSVPNSTGGLISSFSSYGLAPDLSLKPDISAPGGSIYSTYPLAKGGYTSLSGTSMASPHVAGAVALLLEARPHTPSQVVRTILQNTSAPTLWSLNTGYGLLDNVNRQGAGMLHIDRAILAKTRVEPGKLSLGESQVGPVTSTLTIRNDGAQEVTYALSYEDAITTGGNPFAPAFDYADSNVSFSSSTVIVPAGGTASVTVTISPNSALDDRTIYGGYITFTANNSDFETLRVPYSGFKGDYQSVQVLTKAPWMSTIATANYAAITGDGHSFTFTDGNVPVFLYHLNHQARLLKAEVFDLKGKNWKTAYQEEYLASNSSTAGFFGFGWDGLTVNGNKVNTLANGTYVMKISVLKALGNASNPGDWETWTSPKFSIARP